MKSIVCLSICLLVVQSAVALPTPKDEVDFGLSDLFGRIKTGAKKFQDSVWTPKTTEAPATTTSTTEKEVVVVPLPSTTTTEAPAVFSLTDLIATVVEITNKTTTEQPVEELSSPVPPSRGDQEPEQTSENAESSSEPALAPTTAQPKILDLGGLLNVIDFSTTPASVEPDITSAAPVSEPPTEATVSSTSEATQSSDIPPAHSLN